MNLDRILVVGASGFLGRVICDAPAQEIHRVPAARTSLPYPDFIQLDVTDAHQVSTVFEEVKPSWVINTAAITSVDGCETAPELARRVHVEGTRNLIEACEKLPCGLIHISTNYVFDGRQSQPYRENDSPNPLNVYGLTKFESEGLVLRASCPSIVVRTAVLYGYHAESRLNFVTWALGLLAKNQTIRVVDDEWANPTAVDELADFLLCLPDSDFRGMIHFAGAEYLTRYEMVKQICSHFRLDLSKVTPVSSSDLGQTAARPLRAGICIDKARSIYNGPISSFEHHLDRISQQIGNPDSLSQA